MAKKSVHVESRAHNGAAAPPAAVMPPPPMDRSPPSPAAAPTAAEVAARKAAAAAEFQRKVQALAVAELSIPVTLCDMRVLFPQDPNRPEAPYATDRIDVNLSPDEARGLRLIQDGYERKGVKLRSAQEALKLLLRAVHAEFVRHKG